MKIIDLTHTIINDMQVYPGDKPPELVQTHDIKKNGYTNHQLNTGMHVGTHIDGYWHMVNPSILISDIPLDYLIGKGCIIDIRNEKIFNNPELLKDKAKNSSIVIFYTGFGELFGTSNYNSGYPVIHFDLVKELIDLNIKLIGIDTFSPDLEPYNTHKKLFENKILVAENLTNLHLLLEEKEFLVFALPLKIAADSSPARVIAIIV